MKKILFATSLLLALSTLSKSYGQDNNLDQIVSELSSDNNAASVFIGLYEFSVAVKSSNITNQEILSHVIEDIMNETNINQYTDQYGQPFVRGIQNFFADSIKSIQFREQYSTTLLALSSEDMNYVMGKYLEELYTIEPMGLASSGGCTAYNIMIKYADRRYMISYGVCLLGAAVPFITVGCVVGITAIVIADYEEAAELYPNCV